jgi:FkbM family methyltransferase
MKDLPSGSVFIDVGANLGFISVSLAAQRPDLRIISIEPVPHNVEALRYNLAANSIKNVEVVHAAVSDSPGVVTMTSEGPWSSVSESGTVNVPCIMLDQFASEVVTGIKIDVEGYEPNVLAGATKVLALRPLVYLEVTVWWIAMRHHDIRSYLDAIWDRSEMLGVAADEKLHAAPISVGDFLFEHVSKHRGVSDLLFRPRESLGSLDQLICQPELLRLKEDRLPPP